MAEAKKAVKVKPAHYPPRRMATPELHGAHGTFAASDERADLPKGFARDKGGPIAASPWGSEPKRSAFVEAPPKAKAAPAKK